MNPQIPQAIIDILRRPLPPEAVKPHPTKAYLSSIKAIYCVERLNEAFGLNGWKIKNELVEIAEFKRFVKGNETTGVMVVMKSFLTVPEFGIEIEAYGGNDNEDRGDAYKGACTDALTKIASYMYIGMDVYKGLGSKKEAQSMGERKLEALRGGADYRDISSRDERVDRTVCRNCNGFRVLPDGSRCMACEANGSVPIHVESAVPEPRVAEPIPTPRKVFSMASSCEEFKRIKDMGIKQLGPAWESEYYRILAKFDAKHANDLKSAKPAREAYKMLAAALDSLMKLNQSAEPAKPLDSFDIHMREENSKAERGQMA